MKVAKVFLACSLLGLLCIAGCLAVYGPLFGEPAKGTYGAGKFARGKSVASPAECRHLARLLEEGRVSEFNQQRRQGSLAEKYLDLSGLWLAGLELEGVDFSRCILRRCNFSGSNLEYASFQDSYLAETTFCGPIYLNHDWPDAIVARPTNLKGANFQGAVLTAEIYSLIEATYVKMPCCAAGLAYCERANTIGLSQTWTAKLPLRVNSGSVTIVLPSASSSVTNLLPVSLPCQNPFVGIPAAAVAGWLDAGVNLERLRSLPARRLEASLFGPWMQTVVNEDPNLVLVAAGRYSRIDILSAGPVVQLDACDGSGSVLSDDVVWVRDGVDFDCLAVGHPIFVGPSVQLALGRALLSPVFREPPGSTPDKKAP